MLLRNPESAGLRVPVMPRRALVADDANAKRERVREEALQARDARDERMAVSLERARAGAHFARLIADAEDGGEAGEGFTARIDKALGDYKASPGALAGEHFASLSASVRDRAMRAEAAARARDRIASIAGMIDTLVGAARKAPASFATHHETALKALDTLALPQKVTAIFRTRLPEIPAAALAALAEREPERAAGLIKRREGPAGAAYGVPAATLRLLAKQADAAREEAADERAQSAAAAATRAQVDAEDAIEAAGEGEGSDAALTAWQQNADVIGPRGTRDLSRQTAAAAKRIDARAKAATAVREALARGDTLDRSNGAHSEGVDSAYAGMEPSDANGIAFAKRAGILPRPMLRRLAAALKGDDRTAAAHAAATIAALEAEEPALTKRIDPATLKEAHRIAAAMHAGLDGAAAVRTLRDAADLDPAERGRRQSDFDRLATGTSIARALEQTFNVRIAGLRA